MTLIITSITTGREHRIIPVIRPCAVYVLISLWMRSRSRMTLAVQSRLSRPGFHRFSFCTIIPVMQHP